MAGVVGTAPRRGLARIPRRAAAASSVPVPVHTGGVLSGLTLTQITVGSLGCVAAAMVTRFMHLCPLQGPGPGRPGVGSTVICG